MPSDAHAGQNLWQTDFYGHYEGNASPEHIQAAPAAPYRVAEGSEGQWIRVHPRAVFPQFVPGRRAQPPEQAREQPKKTRATAGRARTQPRKPPKVEKQISCEAAVEIVAGYGFSDVKSTSCSGAKYAFEAVRDGAAYSIKLSATDGELSEVKKR
jgi:hypothetical protein